jgi:hypothetical protein
MRPVAGFALVHVVANALLLGAAYYWLGVGEGRMSALLGSFLLALVLVACTSWTYGASLVFFTDKRIVQAYRTALRNLAPLILAVLLALAIYFLLAQWASYSPNPASTVASYLTLKLRKPVSPHAVLRIFNAVLWIVRWVIVPGLLIPVLASIASRGWSGFRDWSSRWFHWIAAPALLLCALWIPLHLLYWVPHFGSFGAEMASFVSRASLAYLLFIAGWLALAFVTSVGRPRVAQPSTVVSP